LLGYHFETTHFVVTSIVPASKLGSNPIDQLTTVLKQTTKLQAFNHYCASELSILGVLEEAGPGPSSSKLLKRADVTQYRKNQPWISLKKTNSLSSSDWVIENIE
jgi:hypothetical protein